MKAELMFNICGLEDPHQANSAIENLEGIIKANISESLQYSCVYWIDHLVSINEVTLKESPVVELVGELLCSLRVLYWFEVLSLIGDLRASIPSLRIVAKLYEVRLLISHALWSTF